MSDVWWTWSNEQTIRSDLMEGKRVVDEIVRRLNAAGWSEADVFGVHLSMEEAVVNAIKHGNRLDVKKSVRVVIRMSVDRIRIEVTDEGAGFNPSAVPDPTAEENLDVPSGRGIMLMHNFMTSVVYNSTGNHVEMEKVRQN